MEHNGVTVEERRALEYVQGLKSFYGHLIIYALVVAGLFAVNLISSPGYIWAKWPAFGWGMAVVLHGLRAYDVFTIFGPSWEKKQVEKRLGRKL